MHFLSPGSARLLSLWDRATAFERQEGSIYYPRQRERILKLANDLGAESELYKPWVAAFAALSPNNSEKTTYIALALCIRIHLGELPLAHPVPSYPRNKAKALRVLKGEDPLSVLKGRKVLSFYDNTFDPYYSERVTLDGHMKNAWAGTLRVMKKAVISQSQYNEISYDMRRVAFLVGVPCSGFQATLWIAHKRVNNILWNAQTAFEF